MFDTVVSYSPNSKLSLMANYDYGQDHLPSGIPSVSSASVHWSGIAGYITYAPNDTWALATSGDTSSDKEGNDHGQSQT